MRRRTIGVLIALVALSGACSGDDADGPLEPAESDGSAEAEGSGEGSAVFDATGVGGLRVGQTIEDAVATGLIGEVSEECDIRNDVTGEIRTVFAELQGGLEGYVWFYDSALYTIHIEGGAESDRGLAPGDDLHQVSALYHDNGYAVSLDEQATGETGSQVLSVTQDGSPVFEAVVDSGSDVISSIWVPYAWGCGSA